MIYASRSPLYKKNEERKKAQAINNVLTFSAKFSSARRNKSRGKQKEQLLILTIPFPQQVPAAAVYRVHVDSVFGFLQNMAAHTFAAVPNFVP